MIQAFIVVPALLALSLFGAREQPLAKRAGFLILALAVLAAVSLSWAAVVDSLPADQRPYIGGSGDNTVLGLIINYNGIHRLESDSAGQGAGPGGISQGVPSSGGMAVPGGGMQNRTSGRTMGTFASGSSQPPGMDQQGVMGAPPGMGDASAETGLPGEMSGAPIMNPKTGSQPGNDRGGGMGNENGSPGITRLFGEGLAGQISWLLPFALIGLLAFWRRPAALSLKGLEDAGLFREKGLTLMAMGLWLLPGLLYFSFTTGFWHTYYIATIAPPLAALVGIGAMGMVEAYRNGGIRGWVLVAALLVTGILQVIFLLYTAAWSGPLTAIIGIGTVALALLLVYYNLRKNEGMAIIPKVVAAGAVALLFVAPFVWACTPLTYGSGTILPTAGPRLSGHGGDGMGGSGMNSQPGSLSDESTSGLAAYLLSHITNETWIAAVPSSMGAGAGLIIETGKPVMSLGGFSGSDQVLTVDELRRMVAEGKIRYFYLGGGMGGGTGSGNSALFSWVQSSCTAVSSSEWGGTTTGTQSDNRGISAFTDSVNHTVPGLQTGRASLSGTVSLGGGTESSLYDCAGYRAGS
jgi:4-amino-4-deoxy-L-arabinose transferase-like glycosyltransferase